MSYQGSEWNEDIEKLATVSNKIENINSLIKHLENILDNPQLDQRTKKNIEENWESCKQLIESTLSLIRPEITNSGEKKNEFEQKFRELSVNIKKWKKIGEDVRLRTQSHKNEGYNPDEENLDEGTSSTTTPLMLQEELDKKSNLQALRQRQDAILDIEENMQDLNVVFTEVRAMVNDQGNILIDIDNKIEGTQHYVSGAARELDTAVTYQKKYRKKLFYILIIALVIIVIIAIVLGVKLGKK
ncbi:hypothetical protein SNEBB_010283 [Seison nebaliae]|nr:hypothetical protein SNEBB_010283 [Seison nebaliae]